MKTKWLTYSRYGRGTEKHFITKEATEKCPTGFGDARPATQQEIDAELERRAERQRNIDAISAFQSRQDYQDACSVRNAIDFMTPENNPLSRLTPEEWAILRKRLTE